MNYEYRNREEERHIRAELKKLHKLAIQANPEAYKEEQEREERRDAVISGLISLPIFAGLIYGAHQHNQKNLAAAANIKEQPRIERTVDEAIVHCPDCGTTLTADDLIDPAEHSHTHAINDREL